MLYKQSLFFHASLENTNYKSLLVVNFDWQDKN